MPDRFAIQQISSLTNKQTKLRAMAKNAMAGIVEAQEETARSIISDAVSNYDSAEPGETYERTGDLGGSWTYDGPFIQADGSVKTIITNGVTDEMGRHYSGLVQGDEQTTRHEEAGWRTIEDIRNDHIREQTNRVRSAIRRAAER